MRSVSLSIILLLLLSGCPDTEVATQGEPEGTTTDLSTSDGVSSTSADAPSTGELTSTSSAPTTSGVGFDCIDLQKVVDSPPDLAKKCEAHPFELPAGCDGRDPLPTCEEMIMLMAGLPACDGIDICDYYKCADALADAPCGAGARPPECQDIVDCINAPAPATNACCDEHGVGVGPDLCGVSGDNFCVDCDWTPVLCMTHGCGVPGAPDCCLSVQGETILCPPVAD